MLQANYDEFGVLYNYAAVQSETRALRVDSFNDEDWNNLAVALGVTNQDYTYICCGGAEYKEIRTAHER